MGEAAATIRAARPLSWFRRFTLRNIMALAYIAVLVGPTPRLRFSDQQNPAGASCRR